MQQLVRIIHRLAADDHTTDADLLDRFFAQRDEAAFAELVERHGPMVLGVCLRVLGHRQDAEDAFQATFLTLVRKGRSIRRRGALGSWLYRVAFRLSLTQRKRVGRRTADDLPPDVADPTPPDAAARELKSALDEEVDRLPDKYRSVLVLCGLQGKSYDEAAQDLGCPRSTVAIRLLRGRHLLKTRLAQRGLLAGAGALALRGAIPGAQAAVAAGLAATTATAAVAVADGAALATVASAGVVALLDAATRDVWLGKCKVLVMSLALAGLTGTGAGVAAQASFSAGRPVASAAGPSEPTTDASVPLRPAAVRFTGPGMTLNLNPATRD